MGILAMKVIGTIVEGTISPTHGPSESPTEIPTSIPSQQPTQDPTHSPSTDPTLALHIKCFFEPGKWNNEISRTLISLKFFGCEWLLPRARLVRPSGRRSHRLRPRRPLRLRNPLISVFFKDLKLPTHFTSKNFRRPSGGVFYHQIA